MLGVMNCLFMTIILNALAEHIGRLKTGMVKFINLLIIDHTYYVPLVTCPTGHKLQVRSSQTPQILSLTERPTSLYYSVKQLFYSPCLKNNRIRQ